jgi:ABC-type glycerol-3-phosphate transport system substrate-binding protein
MKVPVVSALGQKLGIRESELREIIQYIDGGETGNVPEFKSSKNLTPEQVISAVREARYLNSSSIAYTNVALVPAYSDALPLAKKFLKYMTTTEAMQITFEHSGMMPLVQSEIDNLEVENMNLFNKSKVDLVKAANGKMVSMEICSDPLFYMNGLRAYTFTENVIPEKMLGAQSAKDRKSASKIVQEEKDYIAASWTYYCNNAKEELKK